MNRDDKIKRSLDARLSGIREGAGTAWKVLAEAQKKEKPMKKKMTFALAFALALLLAGVALAAGLDVFGLFKKDEVRGGQLSRLSEQARTYAQTTHIPARDAPAEAPQDDYQRLIALQQAREIGFTLEQAYADDQTLSFSYTLRGAGIKASYHEGMPSGDFTWDSEEKDRWTDTHMISGEASSLNQKIGEHLNRPGSHYLVMESASLGDGASLTDGTNLPIQDSQVKTLEDGTRQGYMTCRIPDGVSADKPLEVELVIIYGATVVYQDESGYKTDFVANPADKGIKRLHFTIARNGKTVSLSGELTHQAETAEGSYTARAQVFLSPVNATGTVTIKGSQAWVDSWHKASAMMDGAADTADRIYDYVLYAGDREYPNHGGGISVQDSGDIVIALDFDAPQPGQPLRLRPLYREGGAPEEDIALK